MADISTWTSLNIYKNWDSCRITGFWFTYTTDCMETCTVTDEALIDGSCSDVSAKTFEASFFFGSSG